MTKVGDKVWVYGARYRGPGNAYKWSEREIIGETRVSWILSPAWESPTSVTTPKVRKNPSKGAPVVVAFSPEERDALQWVADNQYRIAAAVKHVTDHDVLRRIAHMIDYKEAPR